MANPLKCDLCVQPATVHLTQIVNNKIHKVDLCEACAQAKGVTDPSGFSLADLLLKSSLNPEPTGDIRCESCGFTQQDFNYIAQLNDIIKEYKYDEEKYLTFYRKIYKKYKNKSLLF